MKSSILLFILTLLFFSVNSVHAQVNVKIETKASGGTASSHVESTVSSSSNTTVSESNTHTDIVIEANGERKEYHSDKPGNVNIEVDNGKSNGEVSDDSESTKDEPLITVLPTQSIIVKEVLGASDTSIQYKPDFGEDAIILHSESEKEDKGFFHAVLQWIFGK